MLAFSEIPMKPTLVLRCMRQQGDGELFRHQLLDLLASQVARPLVCSRDEFVRERTPDLKQWRRRRG